MPSQETYSPALEDDDKMPFGAHQGKTMENVPASYLHYLWTNGLDGVAKNDPRSAREPNDRLRVANYIWNNLHRLQLEHPDGLWN